jgi:CubicO group peptidase (beta-lactamase class C family)
MLPYTEVEFKPGTRYGYSNLGYVFLGQVIERLAGEDYEVYVDKNILKPLGMTRSYFDTTPNFLLKHRSHSYRKNADETLTPLRFDMDTGVTVSNGGLNAPLGDMAKYLNFLIGDTKNEIYDIVLKRSSLEEMWKPIIRKNTSPTSSTLGDDIWMGFGFSVEDHFGSRYIGHAGGQNGFITHFFVQPQRKVGYVAAFNTELMPTKTDSKRTTVEIDRKLRDHLFQNVFPQLSKN